MGGRVGLWCLVLLSIIFPLYRGGRPEKTADLPQVTDKIYHTMLYRVHRVVREIRAHNVSGDRH